MKRITIGALVAVSALLSSVSPPAAAVDVDDIYSNPTVWDEASVDWMFRCLKSPLNTSGFRARIQSAFDIWEGAVDFPFDIDYDGQVTDNGYDVHDLDCAEQQAAGDDWQDIMVYSTTSTDGDNNAKAISCLRTSTAYGGRTEVWWASIGFKVSTNWDARHGRRTG